MYILISEKGNGYLIGFQIVYEDWWIMAEHQIKQILSIISFQERYQKGYNYYVTNDEFEFFKKWLDRLSFDKNPAKIEACRTLLDTRGYFGYVDFQKKIDTFRDKYNGLIRSAPSGEKEISKPE